MLCISDDRQHDLQSGQSGQNDSKTFAAICRKGLFLYLSGITSYVYNRR